MRVFLVGAAICAFSASALAGPADYYEPRASVYMSYEFDRPVAKQYAPQSAALRYGFQLDHDWRNHFDRDRAPILQWEFSDLSFNNLSVAGQPLINREMILNADGEGGFFNTLKDNTALIVFGAGAAILAIAVVDGDKESRNRDPEDPDGVGGASGTVDNSSPRTPDGLPGSNESGNPSPNPSANPPGSAAGGGDMAGDGMDAGDGGGGVPDLGGVLDGLG